MHHWQLKQRVKGTQAYDCCEFFWPKSKSHMSLVNIRKIIRFFPFDFWLNFAMFEHFRDDWAYAELSFCREIYGNLFSNIHFGPFRWVKMAHLSYLQLELASHLSSLLHTLSRSQSLTMKPDVHYQLVTMQPSIVPTKILCKQYILPKRLALSQIWNTRNKGQETEEKWTGNRRKKDRNSGIQKWDTGTVDRA